MRIENSAYRQTQRIKKLPKKMQSWFLTLMMGKMVPYMRTSKLQVLKMDREEVVICIKNKKSIQNHIHNVHACAMALIAESATGFVFNMNTPDDKLILLKSMHINFRRRTKGDMQAVATLSEEQAERIVKEDKGSTLVTVIVTDESGEPPIEVEMDWAWIPRKRRS